MANSGNMMNVVKGVAGGMLAGMAVGYAGKKMLDEKPKMKKTAILKRKTELLPRTILKRVSMK